MDDEIIYEGGRLYMKSSANTLRIIIVLSFLIITFMLLSTNCFAEVKVLIRNVPRISMTVNQYDKISLPSTVDVTMTDHSIKPYNVIWDREADTSKVGEYSFNGVITGYRPKVVLTVNVQKYMKSADDINISIYQNKAYTLPTTVKVYMSDGTTTDSAIAWNNTIDSAKLGTYVIYGQVDGLKDKVKAMVNITEDPAVLADNIARYNTEVLRYNADFNTKIADDVYWVPVNVLGKPTITKDEILKFDRDPIKLQERLKTLYDVILYIQTVNMKTEDGNLRQTYNNISWEIPRNPEYSISHNESNCLGISYLTMYLLKGDYDEVGIMEYNEQQGGHVFNYIKQNGKYYIIDLTPYKNDIIHIAKETGSMDDHEGRNGGVSIPSCLHVTDKPIDYVNYFLKLTNKYNSVFLMYSGDAALPIGQVINTSATKYYFPNTIKVNLIYDNPNDSISLDNNVDMPIITTKY